MSGPLVVFGDTLLDVDVVGAAERLCPDAPAPVIEDVREHARPGGAGLAALLAARDGAEVVLVTALGDDDDGRRLYGLLASELEVVRLPLGGSTVRKTRVRASGQTLLRIDTGDGTARNRLDPRAERLLREAGTVLVSDYGRGVAALMPGVEAPVVWDPHPKGATPIPGCALVTPSESEAALMCARPFTGPDQAAHRLVGALKAGAVAVTLGERGAVLARRGGATTRVPGPCSPQGGDVCGAGDRLASAAALALLAGSPVDDAVTIGVGEASRFVERGAASAVRVAQEEVGDRPRTALEVAELTRARGGRLIATGGCFDLLHAGHVSLLRRARALGDALVVCVNSDASVRRLKGETRPVVGVRDRVEVLRALGCVDAVLVFEEDTPAAAIERLRPDVWVKGGDYDGRDLPEGEVLSRIGAESVVLSSLPGHSTTELIRSIR